MPFDSTLPVHGSEITSAELRNQFNGLDDKITVLNDKVDALPAPVPGTEPAFHASEAANFLPGDKAKLDALPAGVPGLGAVLGTSGDAAGGNIQNVTRLQVAEIDEAFGLGILLASATTLGTALDANSKPITNVPDPIHAQDADTLAARDAAIAAAVAYAPANPGHWAGTPPASLAEAIDRLAAAVSSNGAVPVP